MRSWSQNQTLPKSMRLIGGFSLIVGLVIGRVGMANPIVIDGERRPTTMVSERVDVSVGANESLVTGVYRFRQENENQSDGKDRHVTVFIPVFLPETKGGVEEYETRNGKPSAEIGGRKFAAALWNDITLSGSPEPVELPRHWYTALYVCNIPLRYTGREFEARLVYVQPHFSGDVVAYVPIRPPRDQKSCQITFFAEPGRQLRYVSGLSMLSPLKTSLQITPKHRQLIRVQSVKRANKATQGESLSDRSVLAR